MKKGSPRLIWEFSIAGLFVAILAGLLFCPTVWHGPEYKAHLVAVGTRHWLVEGENEPAPWYVTFRTEAGEEVNTMVAHDFLAGDSMAQVYYVYKDRGQWRVRK